MIVVTDALIEPSWNIVINSKMHFYTKTTHDNDDPFVECTSCTRDNDVHVVVSA